MRLLFLPESEKPRIPVHEYVSEVLEDRCEIDPKYAVVLKLCSLHVILHGPRRKREGGIGFEL